MMRRKKGSKPIHYVLFPKRPKCVPIESRTSDLDKIAYKDLLSISHAVVNMKNRHGSNIVSRLSEPLRTSALDISRSVRTKKDMEIFLEYVGNRAKGEIKNPLNTGGKFLEALAQEAK